MRPWLVSATMLGVALILSGTSPAAASERSSIGETLPAGRFLEDRSLFTATSLPDGRILVIGGITPDDTSFRRLSTAEIWDPQRLTFEPAGEMARPRSDHSAVPQPDGRVLVIGGTGMQGRTEDAELWDPSTSSFTPAPPMRHPRGPGATIVAFPDGRTLVVGGGRLDKDDPGQVLRAEVWDPSKGAFRPAGKLPGPPNRIEALTLTDGGALLVGRPPREWLRWDPGERRFDPAGRPRQPRDRVYRLASGRVLAVGVTDPMLCKHGRHNAATPDAEVWLPGRGSFRSAGAFRTPRRATSVTALPDGAALFYGGYDALCMDTTLYRSAEYWDPRSRSFLPAGRTAFGRDEHTATLLADGRVAFIGGRIQESPQRDSAVTDLIELWDPRSRSFSPAGHLLEARTFHTSVPREDGSVLVIGGADANDELIATAELWMPSPAAD